MWTSLLLGSSSNFRQPLRRLRRFQSRGEGEKGGLKGFLDPPKARPLLFHPSRGGMKEGSTWKAFRKEGPLGGCFRGKRKKKLKSLYGRGRSNSQPLEKV